MKILVVDDDPILTELLQVALRTEGFEVVSASDAPEAYRLLKLQQPNLVVLDVKLPSRDGFDVLREIRRRSQVPVLMLTGRTDEEDKIRGFDLGVDDYLTKPFSYRELLRRIRALLRRSGQEWASPAPEEERLQAGPLCLHLAEHTATLDGAPLKLTATEFRLLRYLMLNVGSVVPTRTLLKQVWGYDDAGGTDLVRAAVHRLRVKLGDDAMRPRLLYTVRGVGIMLKLEQAPV